MSARRPICYVVAPFAARTNAERIETDAAIRGALAKGYVPVFTPYLLDRVLDDRDEGQREVALECCEAVIRVADALLVVGARTTPGIRRDIDAWFSTRERALADANTFRWPVLPDATK